MAVAEFFNARTEVTGAEMISLLKRTFYENILMVKPSVFLYDFGMLNYGGRRLALDFLKLSLFLLMAADKLNMVKISFRLHFEL
jgi:hypothetical protein